MSSTHLKSHTIDVSAGNLTPKITPPLPAAFYLVIDSGVSIYREHDGSRTRVAFSESIEGALKQASRGGHELRLPLQYVAA